MYDLDMDQVLNKKQQGHNDYEAGKTCLLSNAAFIASNEEMGC